MIILDTNVVSEPLKPLPNQGVIDWLNAQAPATLFITSINLAELLAGVETMPLGVASRMIVRTFHEQMWMGGVPVFHGPHGSIALEGRLG